MRAIVIIILLCILGIMIFVISIPALEEAEYAKNHPGFLDNAYDLRNAGVNAPIDSLIKTNKNQ